ncbi:DUF6350 family protein [uncultured Microbacterium sp.]|uniref:cell division protein PerM n=1 Tax=uncultured Microbacterium sp. TaxID=191216 RepID=UPI00261B29BB|nr:DUF6350 family protein [uncultured Microbacterium sp.]
MNRLLVTLLAAFDATITAAVGLVAALAPLTVLWVIGFGGSADWGGLWPAAARLWQLGHLVPLHITLPAEYLAITGIPADAAQFTLSLAPLAFAGFSAIAGARSGARAARAGAGLFGVTSGALVFAAIAVLVRLSSGNPVAAIFTWQAVAAPALVFAVPALIAAAVVAWRVGDDGIVDALRPRLGRHGEAAAAGAGLGIAIAGVLGVGALLVVAGLIVRGGEVVALYEAAHVDAIGAVVFTLGQLAYLPTLAVWGMAYAGGPGFAIGVGTNVSPAGTSLGVIPGIPILGIVPETTTSWMLLTILAVIAVGFLAGWAARARLGAVGIAPRFTVLGAITMLGGAAAAVLSVAASGSLGPGRLDHVGPEPGPTALAIGLELGVGAAIALLTPARHTAPTAWETYVPAERAFVPAAVPFDHEDTPSTTASERDRPPAGDAGDTVPLDLDLGADDRAESGPRPPVD